jgi:hypothetical protein
MTMTGWSTRYHAADLPSSAKFQAAEYGFAQPLVIAAAGGS